MAAGKEVLDKSKDEYIGGVWAAARSVRIALMLLRESKPFPTEEIYDSAHHLLHLLSRDRERLLYSLSSLHNERQALRQGVKVGVLLGDCLLTDVQWKDKALDATVGGLLHTLGKPPLLDRERYSRDSGFSQEERALLREHAPRLVTAMSEQGWEPPETALDVILNINERLDGSGYPAGRTASQLSDLARLAAILRTGCKLLGPGAGRYHQSPAEVYRRLYLRPHAYDRRWVTTLARRYSFYPIGTLVRFSSGALGWVMKLNNRGLPAQVRLVREPTAPHKPVSRVMDVEPVGYLGKPEDVVNPEDYGVSFSQT